ncbi:MAG: tetratricopeptide repeat protein [Phycisphaerales bacterium]|nr:tetratricopeptide repeat protein [Phycisphaerales bacterium]
MPLNIVNTETLLDQAVALHHANRLAEAEQLYRQILQFNPVQWQALHNLGLIALSVGNTDLALACVTRSLEVHADNPRAWNTLGETYRARLDGGKAIAAYEKAIALDPNLSCAYNNLGIVKALTGQITESVVAWEKAIDVASRDSAGANTRALALNNLGNVYLELGQIDKAIEAHTHVMELEPGNAPTVSNLLRDYNHDLHTSPEKLRAIHEEWCAKITTDIVPLTHVKSNEPERRLRIGFVSPDLREHAVAYFLLGLFEQYDRSSFEFFSYPIINRPDTFTERFVAGSAQTRNLAGVAEDRAARIIRDDRIDILIDLAGHTAGNGLRIFAHQPAPVQAAYLGYPVTVGLKTIAWRVTDSVADLPGLTELHNTEVLCRLPRCAWCYRPPVDVPLVQAPGPRPFTFGSFNSHAKITDEMIRLWAVILHQVPYSRLLLKSNLFGDRAMWAQLYNRFAVHGISSDRLILRGRQSSTAEHLQQYYDVDLALDTFPYHGTTTTCEAMYMNVPIVTLAGKTHMSRVGVSLLTAVGLNELIAQTSEEYIGIAVWLASDSSALAVLRRDLRPRLLQSPLTNAADFAGHFCNALRSMWRQWCEGGGRAADKPAG